MHAIAVGWDISGIKASVRIHLGEPCAHCAGSGYDINQADTAKSLRDLREAFGLSAKGVAAEMGNSPQYVADLELARRPWTGPLATRYVAAVSKLAARLSSPADTGAGEGR